MKSETVANPEYLDGGMATKYRKVVARCNFLALDRGDIAFAVKEGAKGMARPTKHDFAKLKRLGRYLKLHTRHGMGVLPAEKYVLC